MVDPTPDECKQLTDISKIFKWSGFGNDDLTSEKTLSGTLALLLGVKADQHPKVLGLVSEADVETVLVKVESSAH